MRTPRCSLARRFVAFSWMLLAAACAPTSVRSHDAPGCVFANPIVNGADPWVIRKDSA
jgi:hypothetical protein